MDHVGSHSSHQPNVGTGLVIRRAGAAAPIDDDTRRRTLVVLIQNQVDHPFDPLGLARLQEPVGDDVDPSSRVDSHLVQVVRIVQVDELWVVSRPVVEHREADVYLGGRFRIEGDRTTLIRPGWRDGKASVHSVAYRVVGVCEKRDCWML